MPLLRLPPPLACGIGDIWGWCREIPPPPLALLLKRVVRGAPIGGVDCAAFDFRRFKPGKLNTDFPLSFVTVELVVEAVVSL